MAYRELFNRKLEDEIASETSGTFKKLLMDLLEANREESFRTDTKAKKAQFLGPFDNLEEIIYIIKKIRTPKDYKAGEGTDEEAFVKVLANQNTNQLQLMFNEAKLLGKLAIVPNCSKFTVRKAEEAPFRAGFESRIQRGRTEGTDGNCEFCAQRPTGGGGGVAAQVHTGRTRT